MIRLIPNLQEYKLKSRKCSAEIIGYFNAAFLYALNLRNKMPNILNYRSYCNASPPQIN